MKIEYFIIAILILCGSCKSSSDCSELVNKEHSNYQIDTALRKDFSEYRDLLLKRFNEIPAQATDFPTYHFMCFSAFEEGKSIKFQKLAADNHLLTVKCLQDTNSSSECHNYRIRIDRTEWEELQVLLDEYDFWTEEPFRYTQALDGYTVILEGTRAATKNCDSKTYQFLGRRNPSGDKIGSLFKEILYFEESLDFRHRQ